MVWLQLWRDDCAVMRLHFHNHCGHGDMHRHRCHTNSCCNCVTIVRGCNCIDTIVMGTCVAIVLQLNWGVVVIVLHVGVAILKGGVLCTWIEIQNILPAAVLARRDTGWLVLDWKCDRTSKLEQLLYSLIFVPDRILYQDLSPVNFRLVK